MYTQLQLDLKSSTKYKASKSRLYPVIPVKRPSALKRYKLDEKRPQGFVVYFLFDNGQLVYIGKTKSLSARMRYHKFFKKQFDEFAYIETTPQFGKRLEANLIETHKPKYNIYSKSSR